jgi:hypothetical protein
MYFLNDGTMKHLTDGEIEDYLFNLLPLEAEIKAGMHVQECGKCSLRAEELHNKVQSLDRQFDSLNRLPLLIEEYERIHQQIIPRFDKDSMISILEKHLLTSRESVQKRLEEIIGHLHSPDFQIAKISSLTQPREPLSRSRAAAGAVILPKFPVSAYLPGNALTIRKADKNTLECQIESLANHTPTIVVHSPKKGINILDFAKQEGSHIYTAQLPGKVTDGHYLIYKTRG